jgi:hypothetical protein
VEFETHALLISARAEEEEEEEEEEEGTEFSSEYRVHASAWLVRFVGPTRF